MESTLLLFGKWITIPIAGIVGFIGYIVRGMHKKQEDTYTKAETERLIDMKIKPVSVCIDHNTKAIEKLETTNEKTNQTFEKLLTVLQALQVKQAKVETKLEDKD